MCTCESSLAAQLWAVFWALSTPLQLRKLTELHCQACQETLTSSKALPSQLTFSTRTESAFPQLAVFGYRSDSRLRYCACSGVFAVLTKAVASSPLVAAAPEAFPLSGRIAFALGCFHRFLSVLRPSVGAIARTGSGSGGEGECSTPSTWATWAGRGPAFQRCHWADCRRSRTVASSSENSQNYELSDPREVQRRAPELKLSL